MKPFFSEAYDFSPRADFNPVTGIFELSGVSRPENVSALYNELNNWLREFERQCLSSGTWKKGSVVFNFRLTYLNSASSKYVLQMLELARTWSRYGVKLQVNWYYDASDDEMQEDGQDIADALEYEFTFLPLN